jgi:hypothetical protein
VFVLPVHINTVTLDSGCGNITTLSFLIGISSNTQVVYFTMAMAATKLDLELVPHLQE